MRVLIGLSTAEFIRKADFLPYFLGLEKPNESLITTIHGQSPANSRNTIIQQGLDHDCTHIFFLDDDMAIPPDTVIKLLAHDKDVVSALYLMRNYPHFPVAFDEAYDNGFNRHMFLTDEREGLQRVTNCGLGCVLIKIEVFKALVKPWVRLGEVVKDGWSDDIGFFNRAREAGFEIHCDFDTKVGHMTSHAVWPTKVNGKWYSEYKSDYGNVLIPQTIPAMEEVEK